MSMCQPYGVQMSQSFCTADWFELTFRYALLWAVQEESLVTLELSLCPPFFGSVWNYKSITNFVYAHRNGRVRLVKMLNDRISNYRAEH